MVDLGRRPRIGIFGGTFDPVHVGHLVAAVNVRHALALDRLLLVVANIPWQKTGSRTVTPAQDRVAMVEAAVAGVTGLEASRMEIERGGVSFTADTLESVATVAPDAELFCVVGADLVPELVTWERAERIGELATLAIVNRPGVPRRVPPKGWRVVEITAPALEVSSTDLRARVASGGPLDYLVPEPVIRCIRERGLYAGDR